MQLVSTLKARARELKAEVFALYVAARHPRTPWYAKLLIVAIVAYALSPIDLIPDFIPVLGLVDEVILLPLGIVLALKAIPAHVMQECRAQVASAPDVARRLGRIGAAVIVALWVMLSAFGAIWARSAFSHHL